LKDLYELSEELGVTYRTLNRLVSKAGITRQKRLVGRRTVVDEDAVRAALAATEDRQAPNRSPEPTAEGSL